MAKRNKPQRNANHDQSVTFIAYILRLRIQPSVPYFEIAEILTTTLSDLTARFVKKVAPRDVKASFVKYGMRDWLTEWLEEAFDRAENGGSAIWNEAREWDEQNVKKMLKITGLEKKGYDMAGHEEMKCQIRWRKEGDWRAGSEPLGRPMRINVEADEAPFEAPSLRRPTPTQRAIQRFASVVEPTPKSFENQIRQVLLLEDALKVEETMREVWLVRHGDRQPINMV